ncbi:MAG TPA: HAD family hydrolase [Gemmatimonadaceae bacterium]|nr:HAD family hydrolase [Gemmatimonadaceae bacterium]
MKVPDPKDPDVRVLATDLDGTFLGGSAAARAALTAHFRDDPSRRLVFVTGRSSRSVGQMVADGVLPEPDAMICDVGTWVAHGDGTPYDGGVMDDIRATWDDRAQRVQEAFAGLQGLRLQEYFGPHRVSYYYDTPDVLPEAHARAAALGCDGLVSDNRFFDVLPRGVNKGATLHRMARDWQMSDHEVLVAGDTLNDLSMLTAGFPAVVVGGAEPALLEQLPESDRIVRASAPGCDGIIEALARFGVEVAYV